MFILGREYTVVRDIFVLHKDAQYFLKRGSELMFQSMDGAGNLYFVLLLGELVKVNEGKKLYPTKYVHICGENLNHLILIDP